MDLKGELQARLLDEIAERGLMGASDDEIRVAVEDFIGAGLQEEGLALNEGERAHLVEELIADEEQEQVAVEKHYQQMDPETTTDTAATVEHAATFENQI